ncbi:MAG: hypothetical protein WC211_02190 [Dehalococcoidia bacterium]
MPDVTISTRFTLLREVFELARAQRHAIQADDLGEFASLLEQRQAIIDDLVALDSDEAPGLPENVIVFPGAQPTIDDDTLAVDTLIRGILEHDRQNEQLLAELMSGVRNELAALDHGARAVSRYGAAEPAVGFIDRVS